MKSILFRLAVVSFSVPAWAQTPGIIVSGVGASGPWGTSIDFANPGPTELRFNLVPDRRQCIVGPCDYAIPANGTLTIGPDGLAGPPRTIMVIPEDGSATLVVRAHVLNTASDRGAELLAVSARSILERNNPQVLNFPAVSRNATTHSNLIVSGISATPATFPSATFAAWVQLFDRDGNLMGNKLVTNDCAPAIGEAPPSCPDVFLADVVAQLGVDQIDGGQLMVAKIQLDPPDAPFTQAAAIWGVLAIVSTDGPGAVIGGANP